MRLNQETTATWEDPVERVDHIQQQAARRAATVGDFEKQVKADLHQTLLDEAKGGDGSETNADPELKEAVDERIQVVEEATKEKSDMALRNLGDDSRLGEAMVGAKGSEVLNEKRFAVLRTKADIEQMKIAKWHEYVHTLQTYVSLRANEGHAERKGNRLAGRDANWVRPGQPKEVYGDGQEMMGEAEQEFGVGRVDDMMEGRADKTDLLTWLAEVDPELGGQSTTNPENN